MTAVEFMQYLVDNGWSPMHAAAYVGGFTQESGLNPKAYNPNDPGGSIGIPQWLGDRKAQFLKYAGNNINDPKVQASFIVKELSGPEAHAASLMRKAGSLEDATSAALAYERPSGYSPDNPVATPSWSKRYAYAKDLYDQYMGGNTTPNVGPTPGTETRSQGLLSKFGVVTPSADQQTGLLGKLGVVNEAPTSKGLIDSIKTGNFGGMRNAAAKMGGALSDMDTPQVTARPMQPVEPMGKAADLPMIDYNAPPQQDEGIMAQLMKYLGAYK